MKSFAYIQNLRIPSEKAHSVFVMKTCEAVARLGLKAALIIPNRDVTKSEDEIIWKNYLIDKDLFIIYRIKSVDLFVSNKVIQKILLPVRHRLSTLIFSFKAFLKARQLQVELVQTSDPEMVLMCWLLSKIYKPRIIYDVHIDIPNWLPKSALMYCSLIVVNCIYFKRQLLIRKISSEKILVLPNGIDQTQYNNLLDKKDIRKNLRLPNDLFLIGYIGRFETLGIEKGLFNLVKILSNLKNFNIGVMLVGGPEMLIKEYRDLAKKLQITPEKLITREQVKPSLVPMYTKACDLGWVVYPKHEHFVNRMSPMKVMELMAAGVPVVASDFPSLREILNEDCTIFVDPDDLGGIKQKVLELYSDIKKLKALAKMTNKVSVITWEERQKIILKNLG